VRRLALLVATAAVAVAALYPGGATAYTSNTTKPIIFVHGYEAFNCPSSDGTATWGAMISALQAWGWNQAMVKEGYYSCDTNMTDTLDGYGSHSAYYSSGHEAAPDGHTSHNRYADIKHLAYHLAWQIYTNYSSKGITVQLVGHSMGSLIIRWMLYRIQAHDANFPSVLYVQDVLTFAGPYDGSGIAAFCWTTQCGEMTQGSSFLNELNSNAPDPQATNGTDWTIMGSNCDSTVDSGSATHMGNVHKVIYYSPCYGHSDYFQDTSTASDGDVDYADPPSGTWYSWNTAPHAVAWANNALQYDTW
jgi:hypothetical protein